MKLQTALKIALECIKKERQKFAFDANLYAHGIRTVATRRANRRYQELTQAMQLLEELKSNEHDARR